MGAVNIIVAVGNYIPEKGYPIGRKGGLPWSCKEDLRWFRETTENHAVIMGRNTYDSIGKPLKNRTNIVITSKPIEYNGDEPLHTATSVEDAIELAKSLTIGDIFVIGGASIYKYVLEKKLVDKIYIDFLSEKPEDADAFFSYKEYGDWEEDGETVEVLKGKAYAKTFVKIRGKNNHVDEQYLNLVNEIIEYGEEKDTRAGKTRSLFAKQLRFNLQDGLPMLTTKKMFSKGVIHELLWFLKGDTNIKYLVDNGVHIWDDDAYRYFIDVVNKKGEEYKNTVFPLGFPITKEEFLECVKRSDELADDEASEAFYTFGDLNKVYGYQWTKWGGHNQIKEVIEKLKTNPDDRRLIVSAWNVADIPDMALPPCHYCYQFYTKKMTEAERWNYFEKYMLTESDVEGQCNLCVSRGENYVSGSLISYLDKMNVPTRKLSCMWNMRSNDICCGLPFNILSYSILTHMVAQCVNMDVDELIFNGGDVHIYENHIEPFRKEQNTRHPHMYALPKLVLNRNIKNINEFTYDDIKIEGYESYPTVKYPLNVGL